MKTVCPIKIQQLTSIIRKYDFVSRYLGFGGLSNAQKLITFYLLVCVVKDRMYSQVEQQDRQVVDMTSVL